MQEAFNPFKRDKLDEPPDWKYHAIDAEAGDPEAGLASPEEQEHVSRIVTLILRRALEAHDDRPVENYLMSLSEEEVAALDPELFLAANELAIICLVNTLRQVTREINGSDKMIVRRDHLGRVNLIVGHTLPPQMELDPGDPANV